MELLGYQGGPPEFGLVFQHGDEEIWDIKMQFADMRKDDAYHDFLGAVRVKDYQNRNFHASVVAGRLGTFGHIL